MGLPVYRPASKDRSAVVAFSAELECWISRTSPDVGEEGAMPNVGERNDAALSRALEDVNKMTADAADLSCRMQLLQEQLHEALITYHHPIVSRFPMPSAAPSRIMGPVLNFRSPQRVLPFGQEIFGMSAPAIANARARVPGHSAVVEAR
jgi:hypothetical protein